jgi:dTDP-4-dehydrorhamnose reductase
MSHAPTVLIGGAGQLGSDVRAEWDELRPHDELISLTHAEADVTDAAALRSRLGELRPRAVLNMSAFHRVDDIEDDPTLAFAVNATGVANLAQACRELDAVLLHVSTDYVFSGRGERPWIETDEVAPVNAYGVSKVAGEMILRYRWPKHFIVRSCGLYGVAGSAGKGGNFVETMLRKAAAGDSIKVVDDQVLTPTATRPLARQICKLAETEAYGTYHATCQGGCSWYEFAAEIFRQAGVDAKLSAWSTAESGSRARRPAYSVLDNAALQRLGLDLMPEWRDALAAYLASRSRAAAV